VIVYRTGRLNYAIARRVVRLPPHRPAQHRRRTRRGAGAAAGRADPPALAATLAPWLGRSGGEAPLPRRGLAVVRERLGGPGASLRAADCSGRWRHEPGGYPCGWASRAEASAGLLVALGGTWRIGAWAFTRVMRASDRGDRCIFAFWHARLLPLVYTHRRRSIAVLISRHRDGELIARIIAPAGVPDRPRFEHSRRRGGHTRHAAARRGTRTAGADPRRPRGPAEQVKPGLVYLASRTGFPVVPVASAARRSWALRSWDRFRIPQPFARVVVAYGEPDRRAPASRRRRGGSVAAAHRGRHSHAHREWTGRRGDGVSVAWAAYRMMRRSSVRPPRPDGLLARADQRARWAERARHGGAARRGGRVDSLRLAR
jgi:lysophospholipid acyltransferase (LPLAT)-like uncharacterized protein